MSTSLIKGGVILIKILKKGILAVVMTALILTLSPLTAFSQEYKPRLTAPNGEPYYTSKLNVYSKTGYGMPNCVAYAYGRLYELNGEAPKLNRGDAGQWWSINKRNGYYDYGDVAEKGRDSVFHRFLVFCGIKIQLFFQNGSGCSGRYAQKKAALRPVGSKRRYEKKG